MILIIGHNCQKCKMLKMRLEANGIDIDKVVIPIYAEDNMELCREHCIRSIPAVIHKGQVEFDEEKVYNMLTAYYKENVSK